MVNNMITDDDFLTESEVYELRDTLLEINSGLKAVRLSIGAIRKYLEGRNKISKVNLEEINEGIATLSKYTRYEEGKGQDAINGLIEAIGPMNAVKVSCTIIKEFLSSEIIKSTEIEKIKNIEKINNGISFLESHIAWKFAHKK